VTSKFCKTKVIDRAENLAKITEVRVSIQKKRNGTQLVRTTLNAVLDVDCFSQDAFWLFIFAQKIRKARAREQGLDAHI
jgi:hypothetical protein